MASDLIEVGDGFWNLRGSFKIAGLVDIGTHLSLIRRGNGKFIFLDSYTLSEAQAEAIEAITGGSKNVEAILNLHPFHTVHVKAMHERFPKARLHGTERHQERAGELPWHDLRTDHRKLHSRYAEELDFAIPEGVDFISANQNVHFSSVLALHKPSATIHSDDTLMYLKLPLPLRMLGQRDRLSWHPTLGMALQKRAGAAAEFRNWAKALIDHWGEAQNLCAAHTSVLLAKDNGGKPVAERMAQALDRVESTLRSHERRYG